MSFSLRGISAISLDAKGRMSVPVRYRAQLMERAQNHLVITLHPHDSCLFVYPLPIWEEVEARLSRLPTAAMSNAPERAFVRRMTGHAEDVTLDGAGRVLVPPTLRERVGLDHKARLLGVGQKFELWSEDAYLAAENQDAAVGEGPAEHLAQLVI